MGRGECENYLFTACAGIRRGVYSCPSLNTVASFEFSTTSVARVEKGEGTERRGIRTILLPSDLIPIINYCELLATINPPHHYPSIPHPPTVSQTTHSQYLNGSS
jgi:hypothetical protein